MKISQKFLALCFCLTIVAVKLVLAADVPDQTIASWSAVFKNTVSGYGDTETRTENWQYTVSVSGGILVIHENVKYQGGENDSPLDITYRVAVSKIKSIDEDDEDLKLVLSIWCKDGENFSDGNPDDKYTSELDLNFSKSDKATLDLVKNKLNGLGSFSAKS